MILLLQQDPAAASKLLIPTQNSLVTSCLFYCLHDLFENTIALIKGLWKRC